MLTLLTGPLSAGRIKEGEYCYSEKEVATIARRELSCQEYEANMKSAEAAFHECESKSCQTGFSDSPILEGIFGAGLIVLGFLVGQEIERGRH